MITTRIIMMNNMVETITVTVIAIFIVIVIIAITITRKQQEIETVDREIDR